MDPDDSDTTTADFAALDALLDEALELDSVERAALLERQPFEVRERLKALLAACEEDAFAPLVPMVAQALAAPSASAENAIDRVNAAGEWRLLREIGAGGMGQVFYAERAVAGDSAEESYQQQGAVKLLWSHRVDPQFRERFFQERRILASIDHPGLARFLDGGLLADGRPWFAMEYIEGTDVSRHCASLPLKARLLCFLELCGVIEYAHQRLILHRDIKPANVLVDPSGRIRVLDFGVAKLLGEASDEALTRTGGTPMTLQYASPEQVTGREVDVRTDIYQLGLLLYELLTGEVAQPLEQLPPAEAIGRICEARPTAADRVSPEVDSALAAIVDRALRKDPENRYPSVTAFAADLDRYLAGEPVQARAPSAWYLLERFVRRNRLPVFSGLAVVLGLAAALLFSVDAARAARAEADRSRAAQQILSDVFMQADPYGAGGGPVTLADALVAAQPSIRRRTRDDPRLAWEVNRTLADIFMQLDLPELEAEAYEAAWRAAEVLPGFPERERLYAIAGIGNLLARTDPAAAVAHFRTHLPESPTASSVGYWLSAKYAEVSARLRLRDYAAADASTHAMARVAEEHAIDSPQTLGRIDQLLAGAAYRAEDIDGADAAWKRAIAHMAESGKPAAYAMTLTNQALHYGRTGRLVLSKAAFERALAVYRDAGVADTSYANALRAYAGLLFRQDDPDGALAHLEQALRLLDPAANTYSYLVAQRNAAEFRFIVGDIDGAWSTATAALALALDHYGIESTHTRRVRAVLARWIYFAGDRRFAAWLIGVAPEDLCASSPGLERAFDERVAELIDHPYLTEARRAAAAQWGALENPGPLAEQVQSYFRNRQRFFDPLDDWRQLEHLRPEGELEELAESPLAREHLDRLNTLRASARLRLEQDFAVVEALAERLRPGFPGAAGCAGG